MKLAACPTHGRDHLANAGAPNVVRCCAGGSCGKILETCRRCRGEGCTACDETGWRVRTGSFCSPYPISHPGKVGTYG